MTRVAGLLYARRLVVGTEGNVSLRLSNGRFLTTPSGRCKGELAPEDHVEVDLDGVPSVPGSGRPSSEWGLHREIYRRCAEAGAVVHGHPSHATACAVAGRELDPRLLTETAMLLGPVPLAAVAVPGTDEVAAAVRPFLPAARAIMLANHGVVAWGVDLAAALATVETVERLAEVTILSAAVGGARPLDADFLRRAGVVPSAQDPDPGSPS